MASTKKGYGLYSSVSCAMNALYMLLNAQVGEHNPYWQEFGLTNFRVVPGKVQDNDSDGPCGLDPCSWVERDFEVYVDNEYIASISIWNCGMPTPFGGWYAEHIRYRPVSFDHLDKVLERVGKNGWHKDLPKSVSRTADPVSAYLDHFVRIDHDELNTNRKERVA